MKKFIVTIIGCGELGSRHLQAISSLEQLCRVYIIEPNLDKQNLAKARLKEVNDLNADIEFSWYKDLNSSPEVTDVCIIATQALNRPQLLKEAAQKGYKKFILEKVVSRSVREYLDLLDYQNKNDLSIWVNCQARAFSIHRYIKSCFKPGEPIIFNRPGGNFGLACNGIHSVDLFVYYTEAEKIVSLGSQIDSILHPSRRGPEVFDLSGRLCGGDGKGSEFTISFQSQGEVPDIFTIFTPSAKFIVYHHFGKLALGSFAKDKWQWKEIDFKENILVSSTSGRYVNDLLLKGTCDLPTLRDSFTAHKFVFDELMPYFNKLMKKNDDLCPVT